MKKKKPLLIIDTDPGHDDAVAIMLMVLSNMFNVAAVTTVAGNASIEKVTRNAHAVLKRINQEIPIFSGLPSPLKRKLVTAVVHGQSGLDGYDASGTEFLLTSNAPEKIVEIVNQHPGEVTILTLGPLSNLARAIERDINFASQVKQLVMMGGAVNVPGNMNRVAEFNFFVDPEAVDTVMRSQIPKVLIPLDVCNQVVLQVADFRKIQNKQLQSMLLPMMEHFFAGLAADEGTTGIVVYDALAAYFLINPKAFTLQPMDVVIETRGAHTLGMTVAEKRPHKLNQTNVEVALAVDADQFRQDFFRILSG